MEGAGLPILCKLNVILYGLQHISILCYTSRTLVWYSIHTSTSEVQIMTDCVCRLQFRSAARFTQDSHLPLTVGGATELYTVKIAF